MPGIVGFGKAAVLAGKTMEERRSKEAALLILLDQRGICASGGSASTSGALDPSHVLLAIGLPHEIAHGSLRITLSDETIREELDFVVETLKEIVKRLQNMSPLYEDFLKAGGGD